MTRIKYSLFFIGLLLGFPSVAQLIDMNLVVINTEGKTFTLYVNDQKINREPQVNIKTFHINEGWCKLKVEFTEDNIIVTDSIKIKPIEKNNHKEITLSINQIQKNGKTTAKFEFISIGDASGPDTPIVPELPVYLSKLTENAVFGNVFSIKEDKPSFFRNYDSSTASCKVKLDDNDIEHFLFLIKKTNDFSNRFVFTKTVLLNNCYNTQQLTLVLNSMDIEMDKLKLSKKAYYHLTDRENAKSIVTVFKFKTMSEDFLLFLNNVNAENFQKSMNCAVAVSDPVFNQIYVNIIQEKHEHDKLATAKKHINKNCFSSIQIKKLVEIFSHDREKLELAKMAYPIVTDKESYKVLTDCFMFSENKNDFLNFITQ